MTLPTFPLTSPLTSPLFDALNHLLAAESWATRKLADHAGKIASIDLGVIVLRGRILSDGMVEAAPAEAAPNVTIRIKPADVPRMLQQRERAFSFVRIEGDADFANTISQISQALRWDAQADLSRIIGDIAARRVVTGARAAFDSVRTTGQSAIENIAEYFLEEEPMLVRPQQLTAFSTEVVRLRDDLERLAKRIDRITATKGGRA